jgi:hypothetical protein
VVFTYLAEETGLSQVKPNEQILSFLGLKNLITSTKNSMMWFFLMNKAASHRKLLSF